MKHKVRGKDGKFIKLDQSTWTANITSKEFEENYASLAPRGMVYLFNEEKKPSLWSRLWSWIRGAHD